MSSRCSSPTDLSEPDYVALNRERWTRANQDYTGGRALRSWAKEDITWGVSGVPEDEVGVLGDVAGRDVVELGCGTAYFSARLAKRGARCVGVDITPAQLDTARRMMAETGIEFQLTYGGWIDVLCRAGFEIERLIELQAPAGATRHEYYSDWDPEWSKSWPGEEIWAARKKA